VDLAHINRAGFFDAVGVHDKSQPLLVTHTGVDGVHPHWRNLDDVRHLQYIADTVGEDFASLGSDWDGAIIPPRDLGTPLELPRLVELMLRRGWSAERIQKILGGNFLRAVAALRP
jgi:membrane dipeptidase